MRWRRRGIRKSAATGVGLGVAASWRDAKPVVAFHGNSDCWGVGATSGGGTTSGTHAVALAVAALTHQATCYNLGSQGNLPLLTNMQADLPRVQGYLNSARLNIVCLIGMAADIRNDHDAAFLWGAVTTYSQTVRVSGGVPTKFLLAGPIWKVKANGQAFFDTNIVSFDSTAAADAGAVLDGYATMVGDLHIGTAGCYTDASYYAEAPLGQHLLDLGHAIEGPRIATMLNNALTGYP